MHSRAVYEGDRVGIVGASGVNSWRGVGLKAD